RTALLWRTSTSTRAPSAPSCSASRRASYPGEPRATRVPPHEPPSGRRCARRAPPPICHSCRRPPLAPPGGTAVEEKQRRLASLRRRRPGEAIGVRACGGEITPVLRPLRLLGDDLNAARELLDEPVRCRARADRATMGAARASSFRGCWPVPRCAAARPRLVVAAVKG
uniref:Uncharacterized protein n=1 Tax=Aegilops tauschii subsp. strangulata TaxID=200361 RepID=A0A453MW60_AEGTS